MRLAASNLAWPQELEGEMLGLLASLGIEGLELAPRKVFGDLLQVTPETLKEYRRMVEDKGLRIVALQAFLFGREDLMLFNDAKRGELLEFLYRVIEIARELGAEGIVYGAPKSRDPQGKSRAQCDAIATEFFRSAGKRAHEAGVTVCLEPNPAEYGCGYICTAQEGADLVCAAASPGVGLHLDTGCMSLAGDNIAASIRASADLLKHFHISNSYLTPLTELTPFMTLAAKQLVNAQYDGWISLEMLPKDASPADIAHSLEVFASLSHRS